MSDAPWLVVGLANPGDQYERTRHNVGAMVLDTLASRARASLSRHKKTDTDAASVRLDGRPVVLARPRSYMNLSGRPIASLVRFYSSDPDHLVVIHDELDLDFGTVRLKKGGGENGHNGLRSTSSALGTKDYHRVRVGIGRPPGRQDPADFVLKPFSTTERKELDLIREVAADAVEALVRDGLEDAQNRIH